MDASRLELRARIIRTKMAALRVMIPNPEGELRATLDVLYGLADDIAAGLELLADVQHETERALKGEDG